MTIDLDKLADTLGLGALLDALKGAYELVDHWQQGELPAAGQDTISRKRSETAKFHHDVVLRAHGAVLVVATNCNGGVKEVLAFDDVPDRWALWHERCPENAEFASRASASLPTLLAHARTQHWFDPCELLVADARSELLPSCRRRAVGGGWESA